MPTRKVYFQEEGSRNELTIHFTESDELYVELQDPEDGYSFQNILLPIDDAREIITYLTEQLKLIDKPPKVEQL